MGTLKTRALVSRLSIMLLLCSFGCASGSEDDDTPAEVVNISAQNSELSLGDTSKVYVDFTFARHEVFADDSKVGISIRLPAMVRYVEDSAEIDGSFGNEDVNPSLYSCGDGGSLLVAKVDEDELDDADNPSGEGDARFQFVIRGVSLGAGIIEGHARYDAAPSFCDQSIAEQQSATIEVVR